jgi:superfamily II DNA or RNA helicase
MSARSWTPVPCDDEAELVRLLGAPTVQRGSHYAQAGAVRSLAWNGAHTTGYAHVEGSEVRPYVVSVTVTRAGGRISRVQGTCSCPMRANCKHVAAFLISDSTARAATAAATPTTPTASAPSPAAVPDWEQQLRSALSPALNAPALPATAVALQFVLSAPAGSPSQPGAAVRLRPMLLGSSGRWVKTGISWQNLTALRYSADLRSRHQEALLGELLGMVSGSHHYYYGAPDAIDLKSLSRRIWPLLSDCRAAGVALIGAGRDGAPIVLHTELARAGWDASRASADLRLQPVITVGGLDVPRDEALALGDPAHGLAWLSHRDASGNPLATPTLHLAQVAGSAVDLLTLLAAPTLTVAAAEEARFLATYYPLLRRSVELISRDGSVELPEPAPPRLHLTVRHEPHHETVLSWAWVGGDADTDESRLLWPADGEHTFRDVEDERSRLTAVAAVLGHEHRDQLLEPIDSGWVPLAKASLAGMATVRFVQGTLPRLAELPDLDITVIGEPADYHEATEAPEVRFDSKNQQEHDWFDLAVTVVVDGQTVPFRDLFIALAAEREFLVLASGTYFRLDRPELAALAALIAESRDLTDSPPGIVRVHRSQTGVWDELEELGELDAAAGAFRASAQALLAALDGAQPRALPAGFTAQLRPYQQQGYNWLAQLFSVGLGGVLADEMGLGKTLQVLALICHAVETRSVDTPFLVVAPTSVVSNWASECARFTPGLRVVTIAETDKRRPEALAALHERADIVVTSYALFRLEFEQYQALHWAGLLLDEAQVVKNHLSKAHGCARLLKTPFKLAITGTPFENHLTELWALFAIAAPGLLSGVKQFEEHYRWPIERGRDGERMAALQRRTGPLMLRRTKDAVLKDLPDKQEQVIELDLLPAHRKMYMTHLHRERRKVLGLLGDMDRNRFEIFRSLTLLRQASLDPSLVDPRYAKLPSTKLNAVTEQLVEIADSGHRVLVFSQFTRFLTRVRDRLDEQGVAHCYLDGKTRRRAEVISRFKTGDAPVFLISLKAGGFGLNLTEADFCIVLDPWWNPAAEAQAVDRAHRIGQTQKVMVYRLVAKETIEQRVMELKESKAQLFASMMDGDEFRAGSLSAADVATLLS